MAQYSKPEKVKQKKPDEFVSFFDHLVRYFSRHQTKLYVLLAFILVSFASYGLYLAWQNRQVENFAADYSAAMHASADDSVTAWKKLSEQNPPRNLREVIALRLGGAYAREQKWSEAIEQYAKATHSHSKVIQFPAEIFQATALENAGKCDKALEVYQKISSNPEHPFRDRAKLGQAQCFVALNRLNEAKPLLNQLLQTSQKSLALQTLVSLPQAETPPSP